MALAASTALIRLVRAGWHLPFVGCQGISDALSLALPLPASGLVMKQHFTVPLPGPA